MTSPNSFDEVDPANMQINAVEGFHLGGTRYTVSFELSDDDEEFFRSYVLDVDMGASLTYTVRQQIEDTIMSHASLSRDRHVVLEIGGLMHDLTPGGDSVTPLPEGTLRRLFHLDDGSQYVVGDDGVGYVRAEGGVWQLVPDPGDQPALRDIHGPNPNMIHACGTDGTLLRLRGTTWGRVDLPDQREFTTLEVTPEGHIYLGGPEGLALALRGDELIELTAPENDFFSIRSFKGQRYWSDANWGLNIQRGDEIQPFRELRHAFQMHASAEKLVVAGWKEIFIFDGETWDGFSLGYDGNIFLNRLDMAEFGG